MENQIKSDLHATSQYSLNIFNVKQLPQILNCHLFAGDQFGQLGSQQSMIAGDRLCVYSIEKSCDPHPSDKLFNIHCLSQAACQKQVQTNYTSLSEPVSFKESQWIASLLWRIMPSQILAPACLGTDLTWFFYCLNSKLSSFEWQRRSKSFYNTDNMCICVLLSLAFEHNP